MLEIYSTFRGKVLEFGSRVIFAILKCPSGHGIVQCQAHGLFQNCRIS